METVVKKTSKIKRFYCKNNRNELMQGILFHNGCCVIGPDVWRMLDRSDCPSYDYKTYKTLDEALKHVQIVKSKPVKAYYLPFY